jgi:hypothetical protein
LNTSLKKVRGFARWAPKSRIGIAIGTRSQFLSGRSRIRSCFHNSIDNVPFDLCVELMIFDDGRVAPSVVAERSPCSFSFPRPPWRTMFESRPCIRDSNRSFQPGSDSSLPSELSCAGATCHHIPAQEVANLNLTRLL